MNKSTNTSVQQPLEITELSRADCKVYRLSTTTQKAVFSPNASRTLDTSLPSGEEALGTSAAALATTDATRSAAETASATLVTYTWDGESAIVTGTPITLNATTRMRLELRMPTLPRNPHIHRAELALPQSACALNNSTAAKLMLYRQDETTRPLLDYCPAQADGTEPYRFDITTLLDVAATETETAILLEVELDTPVATESVTLYGTDATTPPQLQITYESSYSIHNDHRVHTHDLGRFGQGLVDLQTRTLMLESEDFVWSGNRLPVTIRHQYNSALCGYQYTGNAAIGLHAADFSGMKLGQGWRLNLMQSLVSADFVHEGVTYTGYVYVDENGEETYLKPTDTVNQFEDVDGGDLIATVTATERTLQMGEETYTFDSAGRLVSIDNGHNSTQAMTYTNGQLTSIIDGAGRTFALAYDTDGYLTSITAPDGSAVTYTYSSHYLFTITYPDGTLVKLFRSNKKPNNIYVYDSNYVAAVYNTYLFNGDRLETLTEHGAWQNGGYVEGTAPVTAFAYSPAAGQATVALTQPADAAEGETEATVTTTVYTFDDDGDVVGEYQYVNSGENVGLTGGDPATAEGGIGARLYSDNWLTNHDFTANSGWMTFANNDSLTATFRSGVMYDCNHFVQLTSTAEDTVGGLHQTTATLPAGEYTFSARMRVHEAKLGTGLSGTDAGMYLKVTSASDSTLLAQSSRVNENDGTFQLLTAPFTLTEAMPVCVEIGIVGAGTVLVDSVQLESNPFAGPHNRLANGNFDRVPTIGWQSANSILTSIASPLSGILSLYIFGDLNSKRNVWQEVDCLTPAAVRETFTLSGWGRASSLPIAQKGDETAPTFRLRAEVKLKGISEPEEYTADFASGTTGWQFASVQFSKAQYAVVEYIRVYCDYDYNTGSAFFDNIQLVRDSLETGLTVADFSGYETEGTASTIYEDTAADSLVPEFEEKTDAFGNPITETTFTDGEFGTIYRSFGYDANGNNLVKETDARGNITTYVVDPVTSRNTSVTDRCGNKTEYEYDVNGRTTKVTSKNAAGVEQANVSYAYNGNGNLTSITRGDGMAYGLTYSPFHELATIGVTGETAPLVSYAYKNGNGRLKSVTYANGDVMKATYDGIGNLVAEKWYNASNALVAHYKYAYDGDGNVVRSLDISAGKEYIYTYQHGHLVLTTEYDVEIGEYENVTSRAPFNSVRYTYDGNGNLVKKYVSLTNETVYYEYPENGQPIVKYGSTGKVMSHSKADSFGRKVFEEIQTGTGSVYRQFEYVAGEATQEHIDNGKHKSAPTTQLVSKITYSDGRTIEYEYDAEERITKVIDSVDGTTEYTYDALGQLTEEKHKAVGAEEYTTVNAMTYDRYGNIKTKNGVEYVYDEVWRDKLIAYDGVSITCDAQGNPLSYRGHTLTWEKGRQLKSLDNIQYTYNANGIRTSKTVNGVRHDYYLDGTKILYEGWNRNATTGEYASFLAPIYDSEDSVCGIVYCAATYYFLKNQQGDVIAITDKDGEVVARYRYDAWGKVVSILDADGADISTNAAHIANINPFRYRGYYYDTETGLYYLQSRYYDPVVGRFINADEVEVVVSINTTKNLFEYCGNDPANNKDPSGNAIITTILKFIAGLFFGFLIQLSSDFITYLYDRFIKGNEHSIISSSLGDYVGACLACGASMILPISGKHWKLLTCIGNIIPFITKYLCTLFLNGFNFKAIKLMNFIIDLASLLITILVSLYLGNKLKKQLETLKKKRIRNSKNTGLKIQKKEIKIKFSQLGINASFSIILSAAFLQTLMNILLGG